MLIILVWADDLYLNLNLAKNWYRSINKKVIKSLCLIHVAIILDDEPYKIVILDFINDNTSMN